MASPEWLDNYRHNEETIARGYPKVKILDYTVPEEVLDCECEFCEKKITQLEHDRNCGICDVCTK